MSFFSLSKIGWFFAQPSSLILLLAVLGLVALRRWPRGGRRLLVLAIALYAAFGLSPLANILTVPLENRFARPQLAAIKDQVRGILVLGGVGDTLVASGRKVVALTDAAERLTEAAALVHAMPDRPLVFSGGDAGMLYKGMSEAEEVRQFLEGIGVRPARLLLEGASRNTYQNAVATADLLKRNGLPRDGWLLVTSAYHMPRAVGCFRKAGVGVIAWPVDYRTRGWVDAGRIFGRPSDGLRRTDAMVREWVGLLVYGLTGRTSSFFPAPRG